MQYLEGKEEEDGEVDNIKLLLVTLTPSKLVQNKSRDYKNNKIKI